MIKIRIEYLTDKDRNGIINLIESKYDIVECDPPKKSKIPGSKFNVQYLSLVKK